MATKIIINTKRNKLIQFENKFVKKRRIEVKIENYEHHCGYIVSKTPLNKWSINTPIKYYTSLFFAIYDSLPSERYALAINGIDDFGQGKYMKLYIDKESGTYIYPLTSFGNYVVRHFLFDDKPNEDEKNFNIERFKYFNKNNFTSVLKHDTDCFDIFEV